MRGPKNSQIKRYLTPKDVELGPRSEKYENMRIDLPNDAFKEAEEKQKEIRSKQMEEYSKRKYAESEDIPKRQLDYSQNVFKKMADAESEIIRPQGLYKFEGNAAKEARVISNNPYLSPEQKQVEIKNLVKSQGILQGRVNFIEDEVPNKKLDDGNDVLQKIIDANSKSQKEIMNTFASAMKSVQPAASNIPIDRELKMAQDRAFLEGDAAARKDLETKLNISAYIGAEKLRERQIESNKIIKNTAAEINKYSTMADVAGITGEYRELIDSSNKRRAIKAQEEIEKLVI